jgi:hypothetical protein
VNKVILTGLTIAFFFVGVLIYRDFKKKIIEAERQKTAYEQIAKIEAEVEEQRRIFEKYNEEFEEIVFGVNDARASELLSQPLKVSDSESSYDADTSQNKSRNGPTMH